MIELKVYNPTMQHDIECFYNRCFTDLGWGYEPYGRHSDTVNIENSYMQNGCMWCLYDDKQLIGTIAIRTIDEINKVAEIKRLYVLKEYQGKGYGNMLFETALNYAIKNNYNKVCGDTRNDRNASQHLFRKHGFRETEKYNENPYAELYFELEI